MNNRQAAERILSLIDLTNLNDVCTDEEVVELCARAHGEFGTTAAVCIWPRFVDLSASHLKHTSIKVATVVNFPHGGTDVAAVVDSTLAALDVGADDELAAGRDIERTDADRAADQDGIARADLPHTQAQGRVAHADAAGVEIDAATLATAGSALAQSQPYEQLQPTPQGWSFTLGAGAIVDRTE